MKYVPVKIKRGTRKKHLSKYVLNKIRNKLRLWEVYKCTGNYYDCKRRKAQSDKVAATIKEDSRSYFAYIRSKH